MTPIATITTTPSNTTQLVAPAKAHSPHFDMNFFSLNSQVAQQTENDLEFSYDFSLESRIFDNAPNAASQLVLSPQPRLYNAAAEVETSTTTTQEGIIPANIPTGPTASGAISPQHHGTSNAGPVKMGHIASQARTPLHICSTMGNYKIVEILLRGGADVNAKDSEGRTALHCGAQHGHNDVVKVLLMNKADPSILDNQGLSVMHVAVASNQEAIVILLLENGVSPNL